MHLPWDASLRSLHLCSKSEFGKNLLKQSGHLCLTGCLPPAIACSAAAKKYITASLFFIVLRVIEYLLIVNLS